MSAIQTIIETYIRFADEQGLLALRAHRLKLLATIDENDPFARNLLGQCVEEISAIDAGLVRLRPAVVPLQDVSALEMISSDTDVLSLEVPETEPIGSHEIVSQEVVSQEIISRDDDAVTPQAGDISAPETISSDTDAPSLEGLETEPIGIQEIVAQETVSQEIASQEDEAVARQANDISMPDQDAGAVPPPPAPDLGKLAPAAAGLTDLSLIAGSLLAASLAARQPEGTKPAVELLKLQRRLRTRLKLKG